MMREVVAATVAALSRPRPYPTDQDAARRRAATALSNLSLLVRDAVQEEIGTEARIRSAPPWSDKWWRAVEVLDKKVSRRIAAEETLSNALREVTL